jgi:hypothetical protein
MMSMGMTSGFPAASATAPNFGEFFGTNSAPAPAPSPTPTAGVTVTSPTTGSTATSPVHFVASANGGTYPITAMRIYSDGVSMYTCYVASMDTYVTLATGAHNIVVQAWNSAGQVFKNSFSITVGTAPAPSPTPTSTGVTITSPTSGAAVGSPVHVTATAAATSGRTITAMRIYVDYTSTYTVNTSKIDTYLNMATGTHNITINAWDNTGAVYKSAENITVQ